MGDLWRFNGGSSVIYGDLMGFNEILMGLNDIGYLIVFNGGKA